MRIAVVILCALGFFYPAFSQQNSGNPEKLPTAQQRRMQMRQMDARRDLLRAQARRYFDAEMAREETGDCATSASTAAIDQCLSSAAQITDRNLKGYQDAIRGILALQYPNVSGEPPAPGLAGAQQMPDRGVAEFDQMESDWRAYLGAASTAARHQFDRGTGGPGTGMETHIRIVRSHMHELDSIYYSLLYL